MKQQFLQSIIVTIITTFISLSCYAQGSSAPIQSGTTVYNGNLYHMQNVGVNIASPLAKIHIDYGKYDETTTPRI